MNEISFKTKLMRYDIVGSWTFAPIPKEIANSAGLRDRMRVKGKINGKQLKSSLMSEGNGEFFW